MFYYKPFSILFKTSLKSIMFRKKLLKSDLSQNKKTDSQEVEKDSTSQTVTSQF